MYIARASLLVFKINDNPQIMASMEGNKFAAEQDVASRIEVDFVLILLTHGANWPS